MHLQTSVAHMLHQASAATASTRTCVANLAGVALALLLLAPVAAGAGSLAEELAGLTVLRRTSNLTAEEFSELANILALASFSQDKSNDHHARQLQQTGADPASPGFDSNSLAITLSVIVAFVGYMIQGASTTVSLPTRRCPAAAAGATAADPHAAVVAAMLTLLLSQPG